MTVRALVHRHANDLVVLAGWLLATFAVAHLARPVVVWPLSAALLCFTVAGWANLLSFARHGYDLSPDPSPDSPETDDA